MCLVPWKKQESKNGFLQFLPSFCSCTAENLIHSASWLSSQHLLRCFFHPSPRTVPTDYFFCHNLLLAHPSLPGNHTSKPFCSQQQVILWFWGGLCFRWDLQKIFSKTEEGVNEQPTVTTGVICSIKEREDFYAVCASYTERYRHHGNKLVRQQQGTTLRLTITRDIISGGETSKALEFWFLLQPQSHLRLWTSFEFPVCKLKLG